ncbi:uncharacterized protein DS421_4g129790 [Arachis hypogaea]|nr:uncharacterized protein DS421_4g126320 [Arachis hypogaea]QHO39515.1 uncharacterized protein DS421_4g129790 [Arachis hypogaea]
MCFVRTESDGILFPKSSLRNSPCGNGTNFHTSLVALLCMFRNFHSDVYFGGHFFSGTVNQLFICALKELLAIVSSLLLNSHFLCVICVYAFFYLWVHLVLIYL